MKLPLISLLLALVLVGVVVGNRAIIVDFFAYQLWRAFDSQHSTSGSVIAGDASIYYEVHGQGPPLVLLHGGLTSLDVFFAQLPSLAKRHTVIAIDLRGQGRSTMGTATFTYRLLAQDVLTVLDKLEIASADFVGWSDGGIIGLIVGLDYPSRINRLVAIGANFSPDGIPQELKSTLVSASSPLLTRLLYWLKSPEPKQWDKVRSAVTTMWLTRPDLTESDLEKITTPTLIIVGEHDGIDIDHTQKMRSALNDASLIIVANAGHNLLVERPEESLKYIQDFLTVGR